jgi:hypothetical protein
MNRYDVYRITSDQSLVWCGEFKSINPEGAIEQLLSSVKGTLTPFKRFLVAIEAKRDGYPAAYGERVSSTRW